MPVLVEASLQSQSLFPGDTLRCTITVTSLTDPALFGQQRALRKKRTGADYTLPLEEDAAEPWASSARRTDTHADSLRAVHFQAHGVATPGAAWKSSLALSEPIVNGSQVIFETPDSRVAKDILLRPLETRIFQSSFILPRELPPSFNGTSVKYQYSVRVRVGGQRCVLAFRVLSPAACLSPIAVHGFDGDFALRHCELQAPPYAAGDVVASRVQQQQLDSGRFMQTPERRHVTRGDDHDDSNVVVAELEDAGPPMTLSSAESARARRLRQRTMLTARLVHEFGWTQSEHERAALAQLGGGGESWRPQQQQPEHWEPHVSSSPTQQQQQEEAGSASGVDDELSMRDLEATPRMLGDGGTSGNTSSQNLSSVAAVSSYYMHLKHEQERLSISQSLAHRFRRLSAPLKVELSQQRRWLARFSINRTAFELGDLCVGSIDFTPRHEHEREVAERRGVAQCLQVSVSLDVEERVRSSAASGRGDERVITRTVVAEHMCTTHSLVTHFSFAVPPQAPHTFESRHVRVGWVLKFEFITRSLGEPSAAVCESPLVDCLHWELPVEVLVPNRPREMLFERRTEQMRVESIGRK